MEPWQHVCPSTTLQVFVQDEAMPGRYKLAAERPSRPAGAQEIKAARRSIGGWGGQQLTMYSTNNILVNSFPFWPCMSMLQRRVWHALSVAVQGDRPLAPPLSVA